MLTSGLGGQEADVDLGMFRLVPTRAPIRGKMTMPKFGTKAKKEDAEEEAPAARVKAESKPASASDAPAKPRKLKQVSYLSAMFFARRTSCYVL